MMGLVEWLWPRAYRESAEQSVQATAADIKTIRATSWAKDTSVVLEQARILETQETERKRGAENKASVYLAVLAAIIPVLATFVTDFFGKESVDSPAGSRGVALMLFFVGLAYLLNCGLWAFRTFAVSKMHRVDATDLATMWTQTNAKQNLVAELLAATRHNWTAVNWKVLCVRQAQSFLVRSLFTFALLIVTIVGARPVIACFDLFLRWVKAHVGC